MPTLPRPARSRRLLGLACIALAIVGPLLWAVASIAADPEFSMSDAEAVYAYTVLHTKVSDEQRAVLNDAVNYAHGGTRGAGYVVRLLPWSLPVLLLISGAVHLRGSEREPTA